MAYYFFGPQPLSMPNTPANRRRKEVSSFTALLPAGAFAPGSTDYDLSLVFTPQAGGIRPVSFNLWCGNSAVGGLTTVANHYVFQLFYNSGGPDTQFGTAITSDVAGNPVTDTAYPVPCTPTVVIPAAARVFLRITAVVAGPGDTLKGLCDMSNGINVPEFDFTPAA